MKMEAYASIGKKVLKNAIGLQHNRKETIYVPIQKLDEKESGCFSCKQYFLKQSLQKNPDSPLYLTACSACESCPNRVNYNTYEEKTVYINEKNRYGMNRGYNITLKSNGLKLFILLHMFHPDRYGIIQNLNISDLQELLYCDRKTITTNLDKLKQYGYIEYVRPQRGYITVVLTDYESYFSPAKEGGRGYMTLSKELVMELIRIKDLNCLRLFLHQLIDSDSYSHTQKSTFTKSYRELAGYLPGYYKPNHVRKGLTKGLDSPIFRLDIQDASVSFRLNDAFDAKKIKDDIINTSRKEYTEYIEFLNDSFDQINSGQASPENLLPEIYYQDNRPGYYKDYSVNQNIIRDLAKMTWQFSVYDIKDAIDYIYKNYILHNKPIDNYPGLVRTLIVQFHQNREANRAAA